MYFKLCTCDADFCQVELYPLCTQSTLFLLQLREIHLLHARQIFSLTAALGFLISSDEFNF